MVQAARPGARKALFIISFLESSIFPIPPDVMLIPMVLADRQKAFRLAAICTIGSVLGGLLGYAIGYALFESIGAYIVHLYRLEAAFTAYQTAFAEWGLWIILIKGLTPIPYKLVTIASGVAHFNPLVFIGASIITRGARFYLVSALLWKFGPTMREFVETRLTLLTWIFFILLIGGFVSVRFLI